MKISVITPAYNSEAYLAETIESILAQDYADWELIIVDDHSTDRTYQIADEFAKKDKRIKVIRNPENMGVAASRNAALDAASGEYVAFCDADDLWLPQKLSRQIRFMEDGQYVLTYTNYQKFNSSTGERSRKILRAPAKITAEMIYGNTSIGCLTVMVNRSRSGPFHMPLLKHMEDNITWQNILSKGYTGYRLDEVLSLYREGNSSMTNRKSKAAREQWDIYRNYYHFSTCRSLYYFSKYAFHAVLKHFF